MAESLQTISTQNRLDTTNLMKAMAVFRRYYKTAPSLMVNKTALAVIYDAQRNTPFVSLGKISSDMQVSVVKMVPTRGVRKGATQIVMNEDVTVAMKIVMARMSLKSKYSMETGNRWPLEKIKVSGMSPQARARWFFHLVEERAEKMVRARRSSPHFLEASWTPIIMKLKTVVKSAISTKVLNSGSKVLLTGNVDLAKPGSSMAVCKIENTLGLGNKNTTLKKKYNDAAHRILEPILQRSMDKEAMSKLKKAFDDGFLDVRTLTKEFGLKF